MKKWQCSVCGYVHTGDAPPINCPACGADQSEFVEIIEQNENRIETADNRTVEHAAKTDAKINTTKKAQTPPAATGKYNALKTLLIKHHAHPITVHIPNGVLPMAVIFFFTATLFHINSLAAAAFYSMVFVLLSMPAVLYTGIMTWQIKYKGARTNRFIFKIISALVVAVTVLILVIWFMISPDVLISPSPLRFGFLLLSLIGLCAAVIAGLIGGKLVFRD